jgi:hypothetical protein
MYVQGGTGRVRGVLSAVFIVAVSMGGGGMQCVATAFAPWTYSLNTAPISPFEFLDVPFRRRGQIESGVDIPNGDAGADPGRLVAARLGWDSAGGGS